MTGLDTGFFVELMSGNSEAAGIWKSGIDDDVEFIVSCLTIFEIDRLGLKGVLKHAEAVMETINDACLVVWLDRDLLSKAARISRGLALPAMDALILASLLSRGVTRIYTTDPHIEAYQSKSVDIRNIRKRK
jgi:predicted nucleic acid-binding protein